jgi:hypothetical protein
MSMPTTLPDAVDRDRACLRRLEFGDPQQLGGEVVRTAEYRNPLEQRFSITARVNRVDREALMAYTEDIHASFEALADGGAFWSDFDTSPVERAEEQEEPEADDGITIEMRLEEPSPEGVELCVFYVDPPISRGDPPHRYAPDGRAVRARIYVSRGRARLRLFRGSEMTGRVDERSAVDYTRWLDAEIATPRAHVRGLQDGSKYEMQGGWRPI